MMIWALRFIFAAGVGAVVGIAVGLFLSPLAGFFCAISVVGGFFLRGLLPS